MIRRSGTWIGAPFSLITTSKPSISSPNLVFKRSPEFPTTAQRPYCFGTYGGVSGSTRESFSMHNVLFTQRLLQKEKRSQMSLARGNWLWSSDKNAHSEAQNTATSTCTLLIYVHFAVNYTVTEVISLWLLETKFKTKNLIWCKFKIKETYIQNRLLFCSRIQTFSKWLVFTHILSIISRINFCNCNYLQKYSLVNPTPSILLPSIWQAINVLPGQYGGTVPHLSSPLIKQ